MTRSWITLALGALILLPAGVAAQDDNVNVMVYTVGGRPRIGVMVNANASAANNKVGATVQAVTPDGPAAKAGLEAGDIITKFNGTGLAGAASDEPGQSGPGQKLVELAQALSAGDSVKVEYRRGTTNRTTTIVAADLGGSAFAYTPGPNEGQMIELERAYEGQARAFEGHARAFQGRELALLDMERSMGEMGDMGDHFQIRIGGGPFGLELAEMNAGLGEYFGTAKGVLVLENPADSTLPLKAGDVILAIDGRVPATVGQARRIFGSYDSGDVAKFEIMRMKKKVTVTWTVPANLHRMKGPGGMMWRTPGPPGAPATPGSAPRIRVRVTPSAPAAPAVAPIAPAPPPART
jgi:membrane-associated protease RseP (regulator of RpoE activity)